MLPILDENKIAEIQYGQP